MQKDKQDEQVLCISRKDLPPDWLGRCLALRLKGTELLDLLKRQDVHWLTRGRVENDSNFKQLIPYILLFDRDGNLCCYQRSGSESRLHSLWSVGIGGHLNPADRSNDDDLRRTIFNGLNRELSEEVKVLPKAEEPQFLGVINEEETEVGTVHLGLVFMLKLLDAKGLVPGKELTSFSFMPLSEVQELNLELWSSLALQLIG